ncbi:ISSod10, transposase OrfA, partial [Pararhodospirillum photometricum DSM 122]
PISALAVRGVPCVNQQTDAQPGTAHHRVPQAISAPSPSCPGRRGAGDIQKNFPARPDEIATYEKPQVTQSVSRLRKRRPPLPLAQKSKGVWGIAPSQDQLPIVALVGHYPAN